MTRHHDDHTTLYDLAGHPILVVCPRCTACATLTPLGDTPWSPRRLTCPSCTTTATSTGNTTHWGAEHDPYFQLPLWLSAPCEGHTLWAFNTEHLDLLESYVAATLREGTTHMTMLAKLPTWLKSAKHRPAVLRTIRRLRATAPGAPLR